MIKVVQNKVRMMSVSPTLLLGPDLSPTKASEEQVSHFFCVSLSLSPFIFRVTAQLSSSLLYVCIYTLNLNFLDRDRTLMQQGCTMQSSYMILFIYDIIIYDIILTCIIYKCIIYIYIMHLYIIIMQVIIIL